MFTSEANNIVINGNFIYDKKSFLFFNLRQLKEKMWTMFAGVLGRRRGHVTTPYQSMAKSALTCLHTENATAGKESVMQGEATEAFSSVGFKTQTPSRSL